MSTPAEQKLEFVQWSATRMIGSNSAEEMRGLIGGNPREHILVAISSKILDLSTMYVAEDRHRSVRVSDERHLAEEILAEIERRCGLAVSAEASAEAPAPASK